MVWVEEPAPVLGTVAVATVCPSFPSILLPPRHHRVRFSEAPLSPTPREYNQESLSDRS